MLLRAAAATTHRVCGAALKFVDAVAVELVPGPLSDVALARSRHKHAQTVRAAPHELPDVAGCVAVQVPAA